MLTIKNIFFVLKLGVMIFWVIVAYAWFAAESSPVLEVFKWLGLIVAAMHVVEAYAFRGDAIRAKDNVGDVILMLPFGMIHLLNLQFKD